MGPAGCAALELVCLDMWRPYIAATRPYVPAADQKIAFDKFHVARLLGDAVDRVRRHDHRALRRRGDPRLVGTRYWWLWPARRCVNQGCTGSERGCAFSFYQAPR